MNLKLIDVSKWKRKPLFEYFLNNVPGFNLNLPTVTNYLLPIFSTGKHFEQNGKVWLPMAIQVHHAVCDGFHVGRFTQELQEAMNTLFNENKRA